MVRESVRVCQSPWIPIPIPIPSKSLGLGGGVNHAKKRNKLRLTQWLKLGVTVVRGGGGGVLVHHYFLSKKPLILERLETLEKSWFFDANCLSDSLAIPKKKCAHAQSSFEFPIPRAISSKFSGKRMSQSLIPIPSGFKELTIADRRYIHLQLAV
jgi:hypothetical protein